MAVILVVTSAPPLVEGGHLVIARSLERALREAGHRAEVVRTPSNRFGRQASAYAANWLTDVGRTGDGERVDQVISLRYPSFAVRHPRHVCWLNHTMREYYDLWEHFSTPLSPQGRLKERVRRAVIRRVDTYLLKHNVTRLWAQSRTVQGRLERFNHLRASVLHPPPPARPYRTDGYGDYLLVVSRLSPLKRTDLVLRALAEPPARHVRCVIGGDGEQAPELRRLAAELGLGDRVTFAGHLDEHDLVTHLARCRGVIFVPHSEDYGFVTAEAFTSGKPVITASDSGGPLEFVRDGVNGFIVRPDAPSLAIACQRLMDSTSDAERMGQQGRREISGLTWPRTIESLLLPT